MNRRAVGASAIALAGILVALVVVRPFDASSSASVGPAAQGAVADYDFVIPAGTGRRMDEGRDVDVLPEELVVHVGETIRIVNRDDRGHLAGPFFVGAGETLRQTFSRPGQLVGQCSVHVSGRFVLDIEP